MKILNFVVTYVLCEALIFSPFVFAQDTVSLPGGDIIAPYIQHDTISVPVVAGTSQQIKATVTDNNDVKAVTLFYRIIGSKDYKRITMIRTEGTDSYTITLGHEMLMEPGIEYYIQAEDSAGNTTLHGHTISPLSIAVTAAPTTVPEPIKQTQVASAKPKETKKKTSAMKWVWIGLGVLAVGVVAALAGGGDDEGTTETTLTVDAPVPGN